MQGRRGHTLCWYMTGLRHILLAAQARTLTPFPSPPKAHVSYAQDRAGGEPDRMGTVARPLRRGGREPRRHQGSVPGGVGASAFVKKRTRYAQPEPFC